MSFISDLFAFRRGRTETESAPVLDAAEPAAPTSPAAVPATEVLGAVEAPAPVAEALAPAAEVAPDAPTVPSAEVRAQAEQLVRSVRNELPDFITIAVVEISNGQILAGQWAGHSGGAVEMAAANAAMVRQVQLTIQVLQLEPAEQLQDVVVTLRKQLHLLQVLPSQQWLLYLAVPTQGTNLALARTVLCGFAA